MRGDDGDIRFLVVERERPMGVKIMLSDNEQFLKENPVVAGLF